MWGGHVEGGSAVVGTVVYTPCGSGIQAVQTFGLSVSWTAANGEHGPPIVAGRLVSSSGGGSLFAISPANGGAVQQLPLGSQANHFPTPSVGDGLLLAPTSDQDVAFSGSVGLPGPPAPPPPAPPNSSYWLVASDGGIFTFGNASFHGFAGSPRLHRPVGGR